jgi:trans-aconitate methyltransferase
MASDDSQFYTGLIADAYALLASAPPEPAPYERFVRRGDGPALELACGDGRPMLDLIESGLAVEGLDSSADMLMRCRAAAAERGLGPVTLHLGDMANFNLGRAYASIYIAGASITLLPDDESVGASLRCMSQHLVEGGRAMVPFWIPPAAAEIGRALEAEVAGQPSTVLRCTTIEVERNEDQRTHASLLRYERVTHGDVTEAVERWWNVHWLTVDDAVALASDAGFSEVRASGLDGQRAEPDASLFTLILAR